VKILVVDDEQMIRDLATRILDRAGHETEVATTGQEAIDRFRGTGDDIGLIVLDLNLDDMSGEETLRQIRSLSPSLPCIISSGAGLSEFDLPDDIRSDTHLLAKPYRAKQLAELVDQILAL